LMISTSFRLFGISEVSASDRLTKERVSAFEFQMAKAETWIKSNRTERKWWPQKSWTLTNA
jgi:hypothetical protein